MEQGYIEIENYKELVKKLEPHNNNFKNSIRAFTVGGLICVFGELIIFILKLYIIDKYIVSSYTTIILIFFGVLFTGLGIYKKLGKYAGAGSIIPITGFANSVASPAMEFKREGIIIGIGTKIFILAGPVIVYGVLSSSILGGIHYLIKRGV